MPHHLAAQMRSMPTAAAIAPSRATGQAYQLARPAGAGVEATSCRLNETAAVCLIPISGLPHSYLRFASFLSGAPNDMENPEIYMYHHGDFLFVYQKKSHKPACQVLSAKRLACAACALLVPSSCCRDLQPADLVPMDGVTLPASFGEHGPSTRSSSQGCHNRLRIPRHNSYDHKKLSHHITLHSYNYTTCIKSRSPISPAR